MQANPLHNWQSRFFTIWTGQSLSLISSELVQFSLVWWLTKTTNSATVLSIAMLVALLPKGLLSPLCGVLVDRWNRRVMMIVADASIALALGWLFISFATGTVKIWHIYIVILIRAIGSSIHLPAMFASTSLMVPQKHLARVSGVNQMMNGIVMVVVPPVGALLLSLMSMHQIITLDIAGALLAIVPLCFIAIPQPHSSASGADSKSLWKDLQNGFRYIRNWTGAVEMLVISTAINFIIRPALQLIAILAVTQFGGDEIEFGWMASSFGAGFITGGFILSIWGGFRRKMQTSLMGIVGAGLAVLIVGLAQRNAFFLGVTAIFLAGFMMPLCMGPIQALIQSVVDPSMQGRVFTIMDSASTLISPLSLGIAGPIFDTLGPQIWYKWGGILVLLIGLVGFARPTVLNLGLEQQIKDVSTQP